MLFGLQSSTQGKKETEQFVTDGQEKRNEITQQILLKAAKADEMERKHKQHQNVFKDLFGTTQDKIAAPNPTSTKRKSPSESEENKRLLTASFGKIEKKVNLQDETRSTFRRTSCERRLE